MKRGLFFIIGGIVLLISIFLLSYYSFLYFNSRKPKVDVNTLEIALSDSGNVNLTDQQPISDNKIDNIKPYSFTIKNKGKTTVKYQLLIEDFVSDQNTKLLSRKFLNYQLISNGLVLEKDNLGNVKNNILDTGTLKPNEQKNYELKIWIADNLDSTDWLGKSYNYNISVNPVID
ncbi:MAG: hypothetical protein Q4E39_00050 [bacterium]|nr:hypothetical protein [bacterium]